MEIRWISDGYQKVHRTFRLACKYVIVAMPLRFPTICWEELPHSNGISLSNDLQKNLKFPEKS
jgi:hypothetical protein